jgi:hypothetical protein
MLKYASKLFLKISLSVVATIISSYLANQYVAGRSATRGPVSLAGATVDPKKADANAATHEVVKADVEVSGGPSDGVNAPGKVATVGSRFVDPTNDEKAARSANKPAEPTSVPARLHRFAPRNTRISKTNTIATQKIASPTVASLAPSRATTEPVFSTNINSPLDAARRPQEIDRDSGSPTRDPIMADSHLAGRVLNPIIRTALLLLEPASTLVGHADEPQRRMSADEIRSSPRVLRLEPEVTERSSGQSWISSDFHSSRRPATETLRQWP